MLFLFNVLCVACFADLTVFSLILRGKQKLTYLCQVLLHFPPLLVLALHPADPLLSQAQETDYLLLVLYGAVALLSLVQLSCLLNNRIKSDSGYHPDSLAMRRDFLILVANSFCCGIRWQMQVLQHSAIFFICFLRCVSLAAKPVMSSPVLVFASMLPSVLELMVGSSPTIELLPSTIHPFVFFAAFYVPNCPVEQHQD